MINTMNIKKRAFTIKDAAEYLSLSTAFIRRRIERGEIKSHKLGDRVLIEKTVLDEYFEKGER